MFAVRRLTRRLVQQQQQRRHISIDAAVATSADAPFNVESLTLSSPRANEVLVKVAATGICHTDLVVKDLGFGPFPIVLGHEGVGVVEEVGSGVSTYSPGDHVLLTYAACGHCPNCNQGKRSYCFQHGSLNFAGTRADGSTTHARPTTTTAAAANGEEKVFGSFFQQSSFGTYALAQPQNMLNVTEFVTAGVPLALMAPLGCGIQTGAGAVLNTFRAQAGQTVAVFGCGAVGLSAVMAAKLSGCTTIVAVDVQQSRLDLAQELGATTIVNPSNNDDVVGTIKAATNTHGVHYSIDTSGQPKVIRQAFESLRPMGVCGMIGGSPPNTNVSVDLLEMLTQGKSLRGIIQGDSVPSTFLPSLLRLYQQGKFPFDKLVTMYNGGLKDVNRAVKDMKSGTTIKPVINLQQQQ